LWCGGAVEQVRREISAKLEQQPAAEIARLCKGLTEELEAIAGEERFLCGQGAPIRHGQEYSMKQLFFGGSIDSAAAPAWRWGSSIGMFASHESPGVIIWNNRGCVEAATEQADGSWSREVISERARSGALGTGDMGRIVRYPAGGSVVPELGAPTTSPTPLAQIARLVLTRGRAADGAAPVTITDEPGIVTFDVAIDGSVLAGGGDREIFRMVPRADGGFQAEPLIGLTGIELVRYAGRGRVLTACAARGLEVWRLDGRTTVPESVTPVWQPGSTCSVLPDGTIAIAAPDNSGTIVFWQRSEDGSWGISSTAGIGAGRSIGGLQPLMGRQILVQAGHSLHVLRRVEGIGWHAGEVLAVSDQLSSAQALEDGRILVSGSSLSYFDFTPETSPSFRIFWGWVGCLTPLPDRALAPEQL